MTTTGLRHIVLLSFEPGADVDAIEAALLAMPDEIPAIRSVSVARDLGLAEGNAEIALVVDLDDADAWRDYQEHPAHQRLLTDLLRPALRSRTAIQVALG
jgi:hypothetical protein